MLGPPLGSLTGPAAVQNRLCVTLECGMTRSLQTRFSAAPMRSIICCAWEKRKLGSELVTWHVRQTRGHVAVGRPVDAVRVPAAHDIVFDLSGAVADVPLRDQVRYDGVGRSVLDDLLLAPIQGYEFCLPVVETAAEGCLRQVKFVCGISGISSIKVAPWPVRRRRWYNRSGP